MGVLGVTVKGLRLGIGVKGLGYGVKWLRVKGFRVRG